MVPAAEAKITRQMLRLENGCLPIAGVVANDFNSSIRFESFVSIDSLPDVPEVGRKLRKRRPLQKAVATFGSFIRRGRE
jgi:hypothetical protein